MGQNFNWPINPTSVNPGPVQYVNDGVNADVSLDTSVPANSTPLPVRQLNTSGVAFNASTLAEQQSQTTKLTTLAAVDFSTSAKQDTGNASLSSIDSKVSTAAKQDTGNASVASIDTKTPALGQALAAGSVPVVLTAAQVSTLTPLSTVAATQSGTWNVTNVSGTVSLPTGASTETTLSALNAKVTAVNTGAVVVSSSALPTGAATESTLSTLNGKVPALGQALAAGSVPVVLTAAQLSTLTPLTSVAATQSGTWTVQPGNTANTTAWLVNEEKSATATVTSVASSATTVSLLASNSARKNATFYNDSTAVLYLKLGATASTTSYTVQIAASGYYELPLGRIYTGAIDGIWASANGNVRITELS